MIPQINYGSQAFNEFLWKNFYINFTRHLHLFIVEYLRQNFFKKGITRWQVYQL